jgi:copper chaperone CopZ
MVCSKCTDRVENALMAVEGVKDARADLGTGEVKVEVVNESSSASAAAAATALAAAVEELGFGAVVA